MYIYIHTILLTHNYVEAHLSKFSDTMMRNGLQICVQKKSISLFMRVAYVCERTDGCMMDGWIHEWTDAPMDGCMDG